ncbi:bacteriohopanetetrol glucosamine biosynthesis glycosyltransferase HpnI [Glacieibacterium sp.]|uniref:bacteriohopanetetrol glucosamine biosynthesis glycosyltransferase HpnI n=1 Tax=Glacieibacterium sp. TaxID=2860237 RepID=UPI003B003E5A
MAEVAGWLALALGAAGVVYQLATAALVGRRLGVAMAPGRPGVTILKPLHGAEPRLLANLSTFVAQDYAGPVQIIFGVQNAGDPAIKAVEALRAANPDADSTLVVDGTSHGSNAKVSNLINMLGAARHDVLVLSDSDMVVERGYLAQLIGELGTAGGVVTCLYRGRGDAGAWSQLAAMGISYGFLPSVVLGRALGLAEPCMGSTIAIRRDTLAAIGGLESVADVLADDYAIGAGVRALGLRVEVSGAVLTHACSEASFAELARHELRWNATILRLDPGGFIGFGLMNPLPFAIAALVLGADLLSIVLLVSALASRLLVAIRADGHGGERAGPLWLLPIRDLLSFVLFVATFFSRSVDWRGTRLDVARDGRLRRS